MWNIPNRKATHRYKADSRNKNGAAITSLLFLPKRDQAIFGTMDGRCILLDIRENDFFFHTELALSSQAVTGIEPVPNDPNQILVTSTDSRIRCYSLQDNSIICRYKGSVLLWLTINFCKLYYYRIYKCKFTWYVHQSWTFTRWSLHYFGLWRRSCLFLGENAAPQFVQSQAR